MFSVRTLLVLSETNMAYLSSRCADSACFARPPRPLRVFGMEIRASILYIHCYTYNHLIHAVMLTD